MLPRAHRRRILAICFLTLRQHTQAVRGARLAATRQVEDSRGDQMERVALTERLLAAEATANAALTAASKGQEAASKGQEAAAAAAAASEAARVQLQEELDAALAQAASHSELTAQLNAKTAEVTRLTAQLNEHKEQIRVMGASLEQQVRVPCVPCMPGLQKHEAVAPSPGAPHLDGHPPLRLTPR